MAKVIYEYHSTKTTIQCNREEKLRSINERLKLKLDIKNEIYCLYNGMKLNEDLTFDEIANDIDRQRNIINIIIYDIKKKSNDDFIESKDIICPKCNELAILSFQDYQFSLECKNNHRTNNIVIKDFTNKQRNVKCFKCNKSIKETYKNDFHYCLECQKDICPLCKSNHNHKTINYTQKNYICKKHNGSFINYCKDCKLNLCVKCTKEHKNHQIKNLTDLYIDKEDLIKELGILKKDINDFINKLNETIDIINSVKNNIKKYYDIYEKLINNYEFQNLNFELLTTLNKFKNIIC